MEQTLKSLNDVLQKLPPAKQDEVLDFAKNLLAKRKKMWKKKLIIAGLVD